VDEKVYSFNKINIIKILLEILLKNFKF
jgi:hypothetical protein